MELSWSTFLLEIINFLILVWIMKRFFYRPVLEIVEKRRNSIEQMVDAAKKMNEDAEALQQQYEGRLAEWEREKQKSRENLQQEVHEERKKLFEQLASELSAEREKAKVIEQRHQTEQQQHYQEMAFAQGARFAAKLLQDVATPELELRLIGLLITQLSQLPEDQAAALRKACQLPLDKIQINSAFEVSEKQQQKLNQALRKFCDLAIPIEYEQNDRLLAGVRVTLGSWILRINLQDELSGFAALSHYETDI